VENTVPLTLSQGGCDLNFTGSERTVSLNQMSKKIQAAMATVANEIDRQGLQTARLNVFNIIGTPGTPPNTQALALAAVTGVNQRMDEMGAPRDRNHSFICSEPGVERRGRGGFRWPVQRPGRRLDKQFQKGMMVDSLGIAVCDGSERR
jgi:hypothetical protein